MMLRDAMRILPPPHAFFIAISSLLAYQVAARFGGVYREYTRVVSAIFRLFRPYASSDGCHDDTICAIEQGYDALIPFSVMAFRIIAAHLPLNFVWWFLQDADIDELLTIIISSCFVYGSSNATRTATGFIIYQRRFVLRADCFTQW